MLRSPLNRSLRRTVDEEAIARMWRKIRGQRERWTSSVRPWPLVAALASALVALAVALSFHWDRHTTPHETGGPARLLLADGTPLRPAFIGEDVPEQTWSLSDGSRLSFGSGTRWEPLAATATEFVSSVRKGTTTFDVKPGGPRRWVVEAGPLRVEVVGTRFDVERRDDAIAVSVEHGVVLVRGDLVPDEVQRLTAGQHLEIRLAKAEALPTPSAEPSAKAEPGPPLWLERAHAGKFAQAYEELGAIGIEREAQQARPIDRLLALSDVARRSGHPADAVRPLERIIALYPGRPEAALSAVTLGRLYLDQLGQPRAAALSLERALLLGAPSGLREDVYVRLIEAYEKAGDAAGARRAMTRYEREYPQGSH